MTSKRGERAEGPHSARLFEQAPPPTVIMHDLFLLLLLKTATRHQVLTEHKSVKLKKSKVT